MALDQVVNVRGVDHEPRPFNKEVTGNIKAVMGSNGSSTAIIGMLENRVP
jgi:hypothetical protein